MQRFTKLFEPISINGCALRNRIVQPAQGTGFTQLDGTLTDRLLDFHEAKARGGVGLIVFEATYIDPAGRISPIQPGLSEDRFIPGFHALAERVHRHGARFVIQLCHHGRMSQTLFTGEQPVAPSAEPERWWTVHRKPHAYRTHDAPRALTEAEIARIVALFGDAARRAEDAGADGVEIHGAHGYLISQFLSGVTNKRRDGYGGSRKNRLRFAVEIVADVRRKVGPDFLVCFKINGADNVRGGMTLDEACWHAPRLAAAGVDVLNVSAGIYGAYPPTIPPMWEPHGLFMHLAAAVKKHVDVPVIGGGRIVDPLHAEDLLRDGAVDLVSMGRAIMADPELPRKAERGDLAAIRRCIGCNQCLEIAEDMPDFGIHCLVNPQLGREGERPLAPAAKKKRVLVVGGGPAGLKAAETAVLRGHEVVLCERERALGGSLRQVTAVPGLAEYQVAIDFLVGRLTDFGVTVQRADVTAATVAELRPDAVILATGAALYVPAIAGLDPSRCVTADVAISGDAELGYHVVVQGEDLLAFEVADVLVQRGKLVTVVEIPRFFPLDVMDVALSRFYLRNRLALHGVRIIKSPGIRTVEKRTAYVPTAPNGDVRVTGIDSFVFAQRQPNNALADAVRALVGEVHVVGDAVRPRKSLHATYEGFDAACRV